MERSDVTGPTVLITVNVIGTGPERAAVRRSEPEGRWRPEGEYSYTVGLPRILDLLGEAGLKATFFWPLIEAETRPDLLDRCMKDGHEIAAYGHAYESAAELEGREAELIGRTHEYLTARTGTAPMGFRAPGGVMTLDTIPILSRFGYQYDSSLYDDDLPHSLAPDGGGSMVELPPFDALTDATYFRQRYTLERMRAFFEEEFDALVQAEGYACLSFNPRGDDGVGRLVRMAGMVQFFDRARTRFGAQFMTCGSLAAAYIEGPR